MDLTCPACAARYTADEQKLRGKTARMRCRACDTVWLVSGPEIKMSEPKRAAVMKRGMERDHRDLFASQPTDFGSVKQTLRPPPTDASGVAARNESSVLFTVDALRDAARVKTPEPELAPVSTAFIASDDEGVIDLKALASSPPKVGARSIAPLFSDPPPAAFAADVGSSAMGFPMASSGFKLSKGAIAGIAAAAVAVILCSIGLATAFKGEEPVVRAAASMAPIPPPAAPVVTAAAPEPAPVTTAAAATASDSSDDDDETSQASSAKGKKGKKHRGKAMRSKGRKKAKAPAAAKKNTRKAADKCHCKGDFNCIIRCEAKGH